MNRNIPLIKLYPGEFYFATEPAVITTVLGSCVSVCFYCKEEKIGVMCHSVLPYNNKGDSLKKFYFVDTAITYMIYKLCSKGVDKENIKGKLFGGAYMFHPSGQQKRLGSVGEKNIVAAKQMLQKNGIKLVAESTGGIFGRKIYFNTVTGEVLERKIDSIIVNQFNPVEKNR